MRLAPAPLRLVVALAAALLVGGTLFAAPQPSSAATSGRPSTVETGAKTCNPPKCWIAGAFNIRTGHAFIWRNAPTRATAKRLALRTCKRESATGYDAGCRGAGTQQHGCLAIAYRASDGDLLQWAHREAGLTRRLTTRETRRKALRRAMLAVRGDGEEYLAIARCTGR